MHIDAHFVTKIVPQHCIHGSFPVDANFVIDSRDVQQGDIFVALVGAHVDGHDFIEQALQKGASGIIANMNRQQDLMQKHATILQNKSVMFVPDSKQALIDIAHAWRIQFSYPVIAITGSVGKTTTKEMVRNILKQADMQHIVSFGNQNTLIGISLNILKMRSFHKVAVFEVGISEKGNMKKLVQLLRPTIAAITYVGHGHLQGLGTVADVAREKREVFSMLSDADIGIINGDQPELCDVSYAHPVVRFGKKTTNQIQARKIVTENNSISFIAKIYQKKYNVILPTVNQARISNGLCALAVGKLLNISDECLIQGISQSTMVGGRFQILPHQSGSIIIHDAYNSNPESLKASIAAFESYQTSLKKVLVLGDMMELGAQSNFWHRQLGRMVRKVSDLNCVILIGKHVEWSKKTIPLGITCLKFDSIEDAFDSVKNILLQKDKVLLFKASNSLRFSELVQKLQEV